MDCLECQRPTHNKKFCSRSCSATYANRESPNRPKAKTRICPGCEVLHRNPKYCSLRCMQLHARQSKVQDNTASAQTLRHYLVEQSLECGICHLNLWMDKPIPLELDHVDGHADNNVLENVRLICPNCHAQTSTYKNRNKGHGRHSRRQRYAEGKSY